MILNINIKLLTNALGQWVKEYIPSTGAWRWIQGPTADGEEIVFKDSPLTDDELVNIINSRFAPSRRAELTSIFGDPDFLPFSFLQKGILCGAAVCRLVRYYDTEEELTSLCNRIKALNEWRKLNGLPELNQLALAEIFFILSEDDIREFFDGFENPLDALQPGRLGRFMPIPFGSGFLVGKKYLLTNHHILENEEQLNKFRAEFGYEKDLLGRVTLPIKYELEVEKSLFVTNSKLDYTLVRLKPDPNLGDAGDNFGYLKMVKDEKTIAPSLSIEEAQERGIVSKLSEKAQKRLYQLNLKGEKLGIPGEPVNIIQHPKGKVKEIILSSNRVQEITNDFIRYEADADFSSSGSPVFNQQWQLVGLHHAALADENFNIVGQEGIRICRIVSDLQDKIKKLEEVIEKVEKDAIYILGDINFRWYVIEYAIARGRWEDSPVQSQKDREMLHPKTIALIEEEWSLRSTGEVSTEDTEATKQRIETAANSIAKIFLKEANTILNDIEFKEIEEDIWNIWNYTDLQEKNDWLKQQKSELNEVIRLYSI